MGGFIYFTVLKDVGDIMNLSALPTSCIKKMSLYIFIFSSREEVTLFSFTSSSQRNKNVTTALILHHYLLKVKSSDRLCFSYRL